MNEISFTSTLPGIYQEQLEELLFFNKNQGRVCNAILSTIQRYGTPCVSLAKNRLWVTFESGVQSQTLFVVEQVETNTQLAGVVVYTREAEMLVVLFIALREEYTLHGVQAHEMLFFRVMDELTSIARRVKGIESVKLFFPIPLEIGVRRAVRTGPGGE